MVSASVKRIQWPCEVLAPAQTALVLPVQPLANGGAAMTVTPGTDSAIVRVRSVEPSSTTRISISAPSLSPTSDCATSDRRQASMASSSLRAGITTDKTIAGVESVEASNCGSESYYRKVAKLNLFFRTLALSLLFAVAGCDRGSHPDQIGHKAPDFVVQDGSRRNQLSQYR